MDNPQQQRALVPTSSIKSISLSNPEGRRRGCAACVEEPEQRQCVAVGPWAQSARAGEYAALEISPRDGFGNLVAMVADFGVAIKDQDGDLVSSSSCAANASVCIDMLGVLPVPGAARGNRQ